MELFLLDGNVLGDEAVGLLIGVAALVGAASLVLWAAAYALGRYIERKQIEVASVRVLKKYPEFAQTQEDFRSFARKVMCELAWDSVTFTFD